MNALVCVVGAPRAVGVVVDTMDVDRRRRRVVVVVVAADASRVC